MEFRTCSLFFYAFLINWSLEILILIKDIPSLPLQKNILSTMDLKNKQLRDMGDCVMCMSCVKNCEREAPECNLRPLGQDFGLPWFVPKFLQKPEYLAPSQVETNFWLGAIITIPQGAVVLHYLPKILADVGLDPSIAEAPPAFDVPFATHAALSAAILALPGTLSYAADAASGPLETLAKIWRRQLTRQPAENTAIVNLYETLLAEDIADPLQL